MSEQRLTREIAERFIADEEAVDLSTFQVITDDAAASLSRHEGHFALEGLVRLSDAAAQSFGKHVGSLCLDRVDVSADGRGSLETHAECDATWFAKRLTKEIAEQFLVDDESIEIWEFSVLDDEAAEVLINHEAELELGGLRSLSDTAAETLSNHKEGLNLGDLGSLSDAAAQSLGKCKGSLSLDGLTDLSDAAAKSLSKHTGYLSLDGLARLSDSAAQSLSNKGIATGIDALSDDTGGEPAKKAVDLLAGLVIDVETMLQGNPTLRYSESLSTFILGIGSLRITYQPSSFSPGSIAFGRTDDVESLGEPISHTEFLAKFLQVLEQLQRLLQAHGSDRVPDLLDDAEECLSLGGLTTLSDAAAESLAKYGGDLRADMDYLNESAAEILRQHASFQDNDVEDTSD